MFEKVTIGDATLYRGDCMEVMPTLGKVDAVVTDPPYGIAANMKGGTWGSEEKIKGMQTWDQEAKQEWIDAILELRCPTILWGGNYYDVPKTRCWLLWFKPYFPTMADFELAWTNLDKPCKRYNESRNPDGEKKHPTQKPVSVISWCVSHIKTATTILDPFMGSGTTGVACLRLGRKFIGIELEPKYFDIACERIERENAQLKLFTPKEPAKPAEQGKLF